MAYTDIERNLIKKCKQCPPNMAEIRSIIEMEKHIRIVIVNLLSLCVNKFRYASQNISKY